VLGPLWVASTSTTAFTNNPNYIKDYFCELDASSMAGKAVRMKFTLIMQNSVTTKKLF
jgi:hypothetical protein